jgi:predicted nicotinamide N-methyase
VIDSSHVFWQWGASLSVGKQLSDGFTTCRCEQEQRQFEGAAVKRPEDDPEWQALKATILSQVALAESEIQLAGQRLRWLRVEDPEQLLEKAVSVASEAAAFFDPFWAATWRAAQGLDRYLDGLDIDGTRVLELGCGSGQAGVGAGLRGARVLSTDCVKLALQVAELNAWPIRERIRFRSLHWEQGALDERFPVILGSDLVYDTQLFPSLERCARRHLAPDGKLLLSEPHRHTGDYFSKWICQAGWSVQEKDIDLGDGRVAIRIFECTQR